MKLGVLCAIPVLVAGSLLATNGWSQDDDNNGNIGAVVQLPTFGVAIDSEGVLALKMFADPGGRLRAERIAAARVALPGAVWRPSALRKISLRRLEEAIAASNKADKPLADEIKYLAGLLRVQYVFAYEGESDTPGDIIIAGPAEGWIADPAGRMVGATTNRPVILLEDLAVALRAYPPDKVDRLFLGCTIDPTRDGLARLVAFQKTIPRTVSTSTRDVVAQRILNGTRESLGMAEIRTFGVSSRTHFAQILIEADYRMKRIAIGVEPPPVQMATFIANLDSPKHAMLQRWWFTPEYDCVKTSEDHLAMELVGEGVKLQAEDIRIGDSGVLGDGQKPSRPSQLYCDAFTRKYSEIAQVAAVYGQMRSMIDLAVAAAYMRRHEFYDRADLTMSVLRDEEAVPCETLEEPKRVPCISTAFWKRNRLLCPAGGGVSIDADTALEDEHMQVDREGDLARERERIFAARETITWWWD